MSGSLAAGLLLALGVLSALALLNARFPRRSFLLTGTSWLLAWVVTEMAPHMIVLGAVLAGACALSGALSHLAGVLGLALWALAVAAALPGLRSAIRATIEIDEGSDTRRLSLELSGVRRVPRLHAALPALGVWRRGVRVQRGVEFGRIGRRRLKLDVYRAARGPGAPGAAGGRLPAVIHVHGGAWVMGSRHEQGRPLLNHLALNGWIGFNVDYRLAPRVTMPDQVADVKLAIAWVREHADELGVDPGFIALTGGSAGGHLTALAALTAGDATLQPGFEDSDASVQAAVPLYGVYDLLAACEEYPPVMSWLLSRVVMRASPGEDPELYRRLSPVHRLSDGAPPFLVVHGGGDTLVPLWEMERFVDRLRAASRQPALAIKMDGAQHAFDVIPSWRTIPVIEAIERFLHAVRTASGPDAAEAQLETELGSRT